MGHTDSTWGFCSILSDSFFRRGVPQTKIGSIAHSGLFLTDILKGGELYISMYGIFTWVQPLTNYLFRFFRVKMIKIAWQKTRIPQSEGNMNVRSSFLCHARFLFLSFHRNKKERKSHLFLLHIATSFSVPLCIPVRDTNTHPSHLRIEPRRIGPIPSQTRPSHPSFNGARNMPLKVWTGQVSATLANVPCQKSFSPFLPLRSIVVHMEHGYIVNEG